MKNEQVQWDAHHKYKEEEEELVISILGTVNYSRVNLDRIRWQSLRWKVQVWALQAVQIIHFELRLNWKHHFCNKIEKRLRYSIMRYISTFDENASAN